jgi:hypothetical protein
MFYRQLASCGAAYIQARRRQDDHVIKLAKGGGALLDSRRTDLPFTTLVQHPFDDALILSSRCLARGTSYKSRYRLKLIKTDFVLGLVFTSCTSYRGKL